MFKDRHLFPSPAPLKSLLLADGGVRVLGALAPWRPKSLVVGWFWWCNLDNWQGQGGRAVTPLFFLGPLSGEFVPFFSCHAPFLSQPFAVYLFLPPPLWSLYLWRCFVWTRNAINLPKILRINFSTIRPFSLVSCFLFWHNYCTLKCGLIQYACRIVSCDTWGWLPRWEISAMTKI